MGLLESKVAVLLLRAYDSMHVDTHPVSAMLTTGTNRSPSLVMFRSRSIRRWTIPCSA